MAANKTAAISLIGEKVWYDKTLEYFSVEVVGGGPGGPNWGISDEPYEDLKTWADVARRAGRKRKNDSPGDGAARSLDSLVTTAHTGVVTSMLYNVGLLEHLEIVEPKAIKITHEQVPGLARTIRLQADYLLAVVKLMEKSPSDRNPRSLPALLGYVKNAEDSLRLAGK